MQINEHHTAGEACDRPRDLLLSAGWSLFSSAANLQGQDVAFQHRAEVGRLRRRIYRADCAGATSPAISTRGLGDHSSFLEPLRFQQMLLKAHPRNQYADQRSCARVVSSILCPSCRLSAVKNSLIDVTITGCGSAA